MKNSAAARRCCASIANVEAVGYYSAMIEISPTSYASIASEYYDPLRHPTCANFREASAQLLKRWLRRAAHEAGWVCEVGAGKSLLAELLAAEGLTAADLILTDASPSMLAHSRRAAGGKTHLLLCDATALPFGSGRLYALVSSLGDPYNIPRFWAEASRVLRPGGAVLFTTPAYEWATAFRDATNSRAVSAEFELFSGERISVPSWIYARDEQVRMIEQGGLVVEDYAHVAISQITMTPLSRKLLADRGPDATVVEGYLATKAR